MSKEFKITVADDVRTDEIWVELRLAGKLLLEIHPKDLGTRVSVCCEGTWLDTDLSDFMVALDACIKRAHQLAEPTHSGS
jgi:hypothetical protein